LQLTMEAVLYSAQEEAVAEGQRTITAVMAARGVAIPLAVPITTEPLVLMVVSERHILLDAVTAVAEVAARIVARREVEQGAYLAAAEAVAVGRMDTTALMAAAA